MFHIGNYLRESVNILKNSQNPHLVWGLGRGSRPEVQACHQSAARADWRSSSILRMCSLERTPSSADTFAERHTSTPFNRGKAGWCHCRHHTHLPTACRGCIGTGAAQARFCERKSGMPAQPPFLLQSLRKLLPAHIFEGRRPLHLPHRSQPAQSASCSTRHVRAFQAIRQCRGTPKARGLGPDP